MIKVLHPSIGAIIAVMAWGAADQAAAQSSRAHGGEVRRLRNLVDKQSARLAADESLLEEQGRTLAAQRSLLDKQQAAIDGLLSTRELATSPTAGGDHGQALANVRPDDQTQSSQIPTIQPAGPPAAVGEPPPPPTPLSQLSMPEGISALTPKGHFVVDEALSYEQNSSDRLVFRGVEIVPGVQVGLIEADTASRNSAIVTEILRYGLTDRIEIEGLLPYVYRADRVQTLAQRDSSITQSSSLHGSGIGDFEATARYQITRGTNGWPILIGNLRFKSDSGRGPFDVRYDDQGVAQTLAVGSGFLGIEPSLSLIYTSDPIVFFANASYLENFSRNINRQIGNALVGNVDPGNSVGLSGGFAFAVNPMFSFTLGYRHNYFYPTVTELSGLRQKSTSLQVGSLLFGWSFRFTNHFSLLTNVEAGVTSDAPNVVLTLRVPYVF